MMHNRFTLGIHEERLLRYYDGEGGGASAPKEEPTAPANDPMNQIDAEQEDINKRQEALNQKKEAMKAELKKELQKHADIAKSYADKIAALEVGKEGNPYENLPSQACRKNKACMAESQRIAAQAMQLQAPAASAAGKAMRECLPAIPDGKVRTRYTQITPGGPRMFFYERYNAQTAMYEIVDGTTKSMTQIKGEVRARKLAMQQQQAPTRDDLLWKEWHTNRGHANDVTAPRMRTARQFGVDLDAQYAPSQMVQYGRRPDGSLPYEQPRQSAYDSDPRFPRRPGQQSETQYTEDGYPILPGTQKALDLLSAIQSEDMRGTAVEEEWNRRRDIAKSSGGNKMTFDQLQAGKKYYEEGYNRYFIDKKSDYLIMYPDLGDERTAVMFNLKGEQVATIPFSSRKELGEQVKKILPNGTFDKTIAEKIDPTKKKATDVEKKDTA